MKRTFAATLALALLCACGGVSQQQEVELGQAAAAQVDSQLPILHDAAITGYVNQLGQSIAQRTSRSDLNWQFAVVNTDVVNAFALPGGFIYVNRGILSRAENASEVAGVLGHEIEHVVRRHSVKQMEQVQSANVGVGLVCALTKVCENQVAATAIQAGGAAVFAKFSRGDEIQADEGGFANVVRVGLNPQGMKTFFQKLLAEEQAAGGGGSSGVSAWFSDHPGTEDRIADIERMLRAMPAAQRQQLPLDTPEFQAMKRRLAQLPPAPAAPPGQ